MKKFYKLMLLGVLAIVVDRTVALAQSTATVFYDNFNRIALNGGWAGTAYTAVNGNGADDGYSLNSNITIDPNFIDYAAGGFAPTGFTPGVLSTYVDNVTAGTISSYSYVYASLATSFTAPFTNTLDANPGTVTWTFNMATPQVLASGFTNATDMVAMVLGATSNTFTTAGNGYAVVFSTATPRSIGLVRYTGGLQGTITSIIAPTVGNLASGRDFASVQVTYNPASNSWSLSVRDDGSDATGFSDPLLTTLGGYTSVGTATDNTYTGFSLAWFGYYSNFHETPPRYNKSYYAQFDNMSVTVGCTPPTSVTAAFTSNPICSGSPLHFTGGAAGASSYSWKGPNGFSYGGLTGNTTIATTTFLNNGTYTFTATSGNGCPASITLDAIIDTAPTSVTVAPATVSICDGSSIMLTASVTPVAAKDTVFAQYFNSPLNGWTINDAGITAPEDIGEWQFVENNWQDENGNTYRSPDNSYFYIADADISTNVTATQLVSPSFSLTNYANASLNFQTFYEHYAGDIADVDISTNGGSTWVNLAAYTANIGTMTGFAARTISLNAYVGQSNLMVRFNYNSTFGYWWALDNISVTGTPIPAPTWTSPISLYTDPGLTSVYSATSTPTFTVYAAPTSSISYTATVCGIRGTSSVTVVPPLPVITGTFSVCPGTVVTLHDATSGGTWSSSATGVATISATGVVTAIGSGTTTITYAEGTCQVTQEFTVYNNPVAISGSSNVCNGTTTTLSDGTGPGTWLSTNTGVATIGSSVGNVSAIGIGTTNIVYSVTATGCGISETLTVSPSPLPISGTFTLCAGSATTLTDGTPSGTWSSSSTGVATISASGGYLGAVGSGTTTITYLLGSCPSVKTILVNPLPAAIGGSTNICDHDTVTLTDATTPGTWTSTNPTVASIGSTSGTVIALTAGTTTISYTSGVTNCAYTETLTVNPLPAPIGGSLNVCYGNSTNLTDDSTSGTWSTSTSSVATIGAVSGTLNGIDSGTTTTTFSLNSTGCYVTTIDTVFPQPSIIGGPSAVCANEGSITLTDALSGGTWTSSDPTTASIDPTSGMLTGYLTGTVLVTYTLPTTCFVTTVITVNGLPTVITGADTVCAGGGVVTLSDISGGGAWSSSPVGTASVISTSGVVTGIVAGAANITYTLPSSGCFITFPITVNPLPDPIGGTLNVCVGDSVILTDGMTGGTWSTSIGSVAGINAANGTLTGLFGGSSVTTYMLPTGCSITTVDTIYSLPSAITGTYSAVCAGGNTITLSDATTGGSWSVSPLGIASVSAGVVTGIDSGMSTVTYTLPYTGCFVVTPVMVDGLPQPIGGALNVCQGDSAALTDATTGGTWSTTPGLIATINTADGVLTGLSQGTTTTTYTLGTGCSVTVVDTIYGPPTPISGPSFVCDSGFTITLTDDSTDGTWTTSATTASVDPLLGVVTGITAGSATITYTINRTGCFVTTSETIYPIPAEINGINRVCNGLSSTLYDATGTGSWSIGSTAIATISATGVVTGVDSGVTFATYTLPVTGCYVTDSFTVNPNPAPIAGTFSVCAGLSTVLTDSTSGGIWLSGNLTAATVDSFSGNVGAISAGTTTITYLLTATGCLDSASVLVNPLPLPITGRTAECVGITTTLADATPAGVWSVTDSAIATIDSVGNTTGVHYGNTMVTYTLPTGCLMTALDTVFALPTAISGTDSICNNSSSLYTDGTPGGVWSTNPSSVASVNDTGMVTGISAGYFTISYTQTTGCYMVMDSIYIIPNSVPSISVAGGPDTVCAGTTITFNATGVNTGTAPVYSWDVLGSFVGDTTTTFSYIPDDGDVVTCTMISNAICPLPNPVVSNSETIIVNPAVALAVSIIETPALTDSVDYVGQVVTYNAGIVNGGTDPTYQWYVNGVAVTGATSNSYVTRVYFNDTVYCVVTGNAPCATRSVDTSNVITLFASHLGVNNVNNISGLTLFPDPNNGSFIVNGKVNDVAGNSVEITVTDLLGKTIFTKTVEPANGILNETVSLSNDIADGSYFVRVSSGGLVQVMQFVVKR